MLLPLKPDTTFVRRKRTLRSAGWSRTLRSARPTCR